MSSIQLKCHEFFLSRLEMSRHAIYAMSLLTHCSLGITAVILNYRKISNISGTKFPNLNVSHLGLQLVVFAQYIEVTCLGENEDVVGAVLTGNGTTTSEWSTI